MREYVPRDAALVPDNASRVFAGKIFDVYQWPQKLFDGTVGTFEMLRRKDTVKIIAIKDGKVVITHQKQPGSGWFYDLPGGRSDHPEENELAAAQREMLEETGMTFRSWRLIDVRQPSKMIDWLVYTFVATDFVDQRPQHLDGGELIELEEVDFEQLKKLACDKKGRRFLNEGVIQDYDSLEKLLSLPAIYNY